MFKIKKSFALVSVLLLSFVLGACQHESTQQATNSSVKIESRQIYQTGNQKIVQSFKQKKSNVWLSGSGVVTRLLRTDNDGSRHQKFVVKVDGSSQTIQIVLNIDIAPEIKTLRAGDTVEFHGEYIYNKQGGLVHWTHHDPNGKKEGGYITVNNQKTYR